MSEVWADGFVCLAMSDQQLTGPALVGLQSSTVLTTASQPLPNDPAMMARPGVEFLGRVIVEFWVGRPAVVAAIGSDKARLVALTTERLNQLNAQVRQT
jgi:hypothetical protein